MKSESLRNALIHAFERAEATDYAPRTAVLRLVLTAIRDRDIQAREHGGDAMSDAQILDLLNVMLAQRMTLVEEHEQSGRLDEAERERAEIAAIRALLPRQLDETEMARACQAAVREVDARSLRDVGRCVSVLKQ